MTTLGLISDTHIPDRAAELNPRVLQIFEEARVSQILHAGDIMNQTVLDELAQVAPVQAVCGNRDVWIYNRTTGLKEPFINSDLNESDPVFSPDGRWLAYTSDLGGQTNVYVYSFPERLGPFKISTDGGSGPAWALDGREIFYCRGTGPTWDMCAVRVATSPKFIVSNPVVLLNFPRSRVSITSPVRNYDISPRDGRFLMIGRGPQQNEAVTEFVLIQNWFEELKRLVPTGKK